MDLKPGFLDGLSRNQLYFGYCLVCLFVFWPAVWFQSHWEDLNNIALLTVLMISVGMQWHLIGRAWRENEALGDRLMVIGSDLAMTLAFLFPTSILFLLITAQSVN